MNHVKRLINMYRYQYSVHEVGRHHITWYRRAKNARAHAKVMAQTHKNDWIVTKFDMNYVKIWTETVTP